MTEKNRIRAEFIEGGWRQIYRQKFPEAPEITHEDILIFQKQAGV